MKLKKRMNRRRRMLRKVKCWLGQHEWDFNKDGWTHYTWTLCHHCYKMKPGTLNKELNQGKWKDKKALKEL